MKWRPDLTQDAAVRRGRALALQIRVDQITKHLKSGKLEVENAKDSPLVTEILDPSSSDPHIDSKSEMLELEKRVWPIGSMVPARSIMQTGILEI